MRSVALVTFALAAAVLAGTLPAAASNAIAKAEGDMACTVCHDKPGSKLLTDKGKYYELMSSLEGFDEIEASFGECVSCHVKKPGSLKLTKKGRRFQWLLVDMEGLRDLVLSHHPESPPVADQEQAGDAGEASEPPSHP